MSFLQSFLGPTFHDERGFFVVSILLLANIFLGICYNLSIWYKLTDKTLFRRSFFSCWRCNYNSNESNLNT